METRFKWVDVKIMVPLWVPIIIRHLIFRVPGYPKRDHNFDNHPCGVYTIRSASDQCSGITLPLDAETRFKKSLMDLCNAYTSKMPKERPAGGACISSGFLPVRLFELYQPRPTHENLFPWYMMVLHPGGGYSYYIGGGNVVIRGSGRQ